MTEIAFPVANADILARRGAIVAGLRGLLPADCVIDRPQERRAYETDALTAYRRLPLAVVMPRTTDDVSDALRYLHRQSAPLTPPGAGTSLSGGSIPQEDAVVACVAKMNRVLDINFADRTVRVEAGVTNLAISDAVAHEGFFYAPDPSSQIACTIGGNVAENSGGVHCLKYGMTTHNLLRCEMVLIDGQSIPLRGAAPGPPRLEPP